MWFRLTENGCLAQVDRVVLGYRRPRGKQSAQTRRMWVLTDAMLQKRTASPGLSAEQREPLRFGLRWHWAKEHWEDGHSWSAAQQIRHALKVFVLFYTSSGAR